eukprot:TRINITY_DN2919_c0_g1_i6.p4 TRINITY_DN2919_c0_g1~~TRINITY_DN2919_c0_g1_i6.p4  ORF type:complete len:115 (+),score=27.40 TRINITY_DN2919_c0_g1_i6:1305-1649(+)
MKNNLTFCQLETLRKDYQCKNLDNYKSNCTESKLELPQCDEKIAATKYFCGEGMKTLQELDENTYWCCKCKAPLSTIILISVSLGISSILFVTCLLYTSPSPRDRQKSRMPSSA